MIRGRPDRLTSACYLDRTRTVPLVLTRFDWSLATLSLSLSLSFSLSLCLSQAFLVSSYIGGWGPRKRKFFSGVGEQFILAEGPSIFRKSQGLFFHDILARASFFTTSWPRTSFRRRCNQHICLKPGTFFMVMGYTYELYPFVQFVL